MECGSCGWVSSCEGFDPLVFVRGDGREFCVPEWLFVLEVLLSAETFLPAFSVLEVPAVLFLEVVGSAKGLSESGGVCGSKCPGPSLWVSGGQGVAGEQLEDFLDTSAVVAESIGQSARGPFVGGAAGQGFIHVGGEMAEDAKDWSGAVSASWGGGVAFPEFDGQAPGVGVSTLSFANSCAQTVLCKLVQVDGDGLVAVCGVFGQGAAASVDVDAALFVAH